MMTVEDVNKIDMIGISLDDQDMVNLGISDHLIWGPPIEEHLYKLQEKINSYIQFIETGEIYNAFPETKGTNKKNIIIYFKHTPPKESMFFFEGVEKVLKSINVSLVIKVL